MPTTWRTGEEEKGNEGVEAKGGYEDSVVGEVLSYGRERRVILEAPKHDKDCVLGNILASLFLSFSDASKTDFHMQAAKSRLEEATSYEKSVFDSVSYLFSQDRDDDVAVELHSKLLKNFPRDLVSLNRAQGLCFYMGRPDLSLDLVRQVLPYNQREDYIYGMLAFPLLELGQMADAEEAAKKGFEINKKDIWSQHALCHVLQYECRFKEAVQFMEECSSTWGSCHSPIRKVLEVYDNHIWKELEKTDAVHPEVYLNALGLLLRVYVRGELDVFEDRLKIIADCVKDQANWNLVWYFDVLILVTLAITGELSKAEELLEGLKSRGNDKKALELLGPDFDANACKIIAASDEQLDVFNEVWYSMLLNTGQAVKAIEVLEKQIKKREGNPFVWRLLERAYSMANRQEAASVGEKARALEAVYFEQPVAT
ncbi:hypothetical protein EZV62_017743 [Acer yangbiense]|uniref:Tetratricopeptide repeat protein 38 n=1 Tax=Acer yangbiense TaxID=1000413 RepID=A0A5C7HH89_9ROSI|nr:hypothetical protein EZV62_017743 [Acer yangbiense]